MDSFVVLLRAWLAEFLPFLLNFFPIWLSVWALCLFLLIALSRPLKPRLHSQVALLDDRLGSRMRSWRYRSQSSSGGGSGEAGSERTLLSWFFRFWTNFASAPSLSVFAFAVPIWFFSQRLSASSGEAFEETQKWLLPLFGYFGSMGLSYVLKRVFKRPRPVRKSGAFGYRLRDGSFPSGHSLTAFCFWVPMVFSVASQTTVITSFSFALVAALIVLLTGTSRIYMAVHWASDVLGGFAIGAVWMALFLPICSGWFLQ